MAEETLNDSFPDLNELENKIGRKTPESLLIWMKEAADCEDGWRSDVLDGEDQNAAACDSLSDKINNLKQEMRWLRSADVRILRQLVAVHEGIEAMRWLMEDRATLTSSCSSLTGSLSSLATVDEHGPSTPPYRESPSPAFPQDWTEATTEERGNQRPPQTDSGDSSHSATLSSESSEARAPNPSPSNSVVSRSAHGGHCQEPVAPANSLVGSNEPKSEKQDWSATRFRNIKSGAETIRRVLLRSSRVRRGLKLDSGSCALSQELEKKNTAQPSEESATASQDNKNEEEQSSPVGENVLLSYDAQCCWVGTQDDVTYL
ncbi:uncharacterized protein PAE49_015854 [Odontesthes bonariensis]|uniref:uncharacterized protein LOC142398404 n=1 Tax=Odontesthes bonariensis TaxID=219752 RepID=UPI003F58082A